MNILEKRERLKNRKELLKDEIELKEFLIEKYKSGDNYFDLDHTQTGCYIRLREKDKKINKTTLNPINSDCYIRSLKDEHKYIQIVTVVFKGDKPIV